MGAKTIRIFTAGALLLFGRVRAFTLTVETRGVDAYDGTSNTIYFHFCSGGPQCERTSTTEWTSDFPRGSRNEIEIALDHVPTVMDIENLGNDAWWLSAIYWEENSLLGNGSVILFDAEGHGLTHGYPYQSTWRFFDLDESGYTYDVRVQACSGSESTFVKAVFCSLGPCNSAYVDELETTLEAGSVGGEWTSTKVPIQFNPLAMRLVELDAGGADWCAQQITFNGFALLTETISVSRFEEGADGTLYYVVENLQKHGTLPPATPSPTVQASSTWGTPVPSALSPTSSRHTPAPSPHTPAPSTHAQNPSSINLAEGEEGSDGKWLDAAWEIALTVVATLFAAAAVGVASMILKRWQSQRNSTS